MAKKSNQSHDLMRECYTSLLIKLDGGTHQLAPVFDEALDGPDDGREDKAKVFLSPRDIMAELDKHVIGQDRAKRALSTAAYNHGKRMANGVCASEIGKSNIMMIGDTGVGKTLLVSKLAKILDVPFIIEDANQLTQEGFQGRSVINMFRSLINSANGDVEAASYGIIFIDEIDKLAQIDSQSSVATRDVQNSLLKMIEGTTIEVKLSSPEEMMAGQVRPTVQFDTSNILFICGGAFQKIDEVVKKRKDKEAGSGGIGFGANVGAKPSSQMDKKAIYDEVIIEDLIKFGMTPELCGRLHHVVRLEPLTEDILVRILTEPEDAVTKQYQRNFHLDGIDLSFTRPALEAIAKYCMGHGTGARGLQSTLERVLEDFLFDLPNTGVNELKVCKKVVGQRLK